MLFGYIRPYKPELRMKDFEAYRGVYCGLCHALGRRYSFIMRMILSYDFTFLAMLQMSASPACAGFEKKRCPAKFYLRKTVCCRQNDDLSLAADAAVVLFYHKVKDNRRDAGFWKRMAAAVLLFVTAPFYRRAAKKRPELCNIADAYMAQQAQAEQSGAGMDAAAHPTALMMSKLVRLALAGRADERVLDRMGYFLGRWIYYADAADDLSEDVKSGDFNVFAREYSLTAGHEQPLPQAKESIRGTLNGCVYEITAAFALLPAGRFTPVLENILYLGLPHVQEDILSGRKLRPL